MKSIRLSLKVIRLSCLGLGVLFVFSLVLLLVLLRVIFPDWYVWHPIKLSLNGVRCLEIKDEFEYFYDSSDFKMPTNAGIILSCNDHSSFHWDGEYYVVFDTTAQEINNYLQHHVWETSWQRGPVPDELTSSTGLSKKFLETFKSPNVWYLAEDSHPVEKSQVSPFHNGRLMVISPENNRVFYSQWDF